MLEKRNKRVDNALDIIYDYTPLELIHDIFETPDFVEVRGTCSGDILKFKVYDDGRVYEI